MMDYLIYCTMALPIFICLFYIYAKRKLSYWNKRGVKNLPPHLLFGNFKECIFLKKAPNDFMREMYESVDSDEPYVGFYIFHKPILLLRDHKLIKQIMITDFETFPNRRFGSSNERDVLGLDSILSIRQPRWRYLRRKLTPSMTAHKLKNMIPLMIKCNEEMIEFLDNLPVNEANRKTCEVRELSSSFSANLLASCIFGIEMNSFNKNEMGILNNGYKIFRSSLAGMIFIIFFFIPQLSFLLKPIIMGPSKYFHKIFWKSMNAREKTQVKRGDLLDYLLLLKNEEQNSLYKFEGDNLLTQVSTFFIAAFESGATAIAFTLYQLACHPKYQAILYDEIETYLSGKEWTMDAFNEMSFMEDILLESLRLFPPLPITDRIAEKDYKVPDTDLIIEKGTSVYLSLSAIGRDPRYYSDPHTFNPFRKYEEKKFFDHIAFGIGPRSCLGMKMALLFMKIALASIIKNYTLHVCEANKLDNEKILHHVFIYPANGIYVQFEKRDKSM